MHVGRIVTPAIVTMLGLDVGAMMGGALFTEQAFGLPGLGYIAYSSIQSLDYPLTIGTITFAAFMAVVLNAVADLFQAVLDPADPAVGSLLRVHVCRVISYPEAVRL